MPSQWLGISCFLVTMLAFIAISQGSPYIQVTKHYAKPFLIIYLGHSTYMLLGTAHVLILKCLGQPVSSIADKTRRAFTDQYAAQGWINAGDKDRRTFPWRVFAVYSTIWAIFQCVPSIFWLLSAQYTSMVDITAIVATRVFWTYAISVIFRLDTLNIQYSAAVAIAFAGVLIICYGSASDPLATYQSPFFGAVLAMIDSILSAIYFVAFKKYATFDPKTKTNDQELPMTTQPLLHRSLSPRPPLTDLPANLRNTKYRSDDGALDDQTFMAHGMAITTGAGLASFILFFPVLLVIDLLGWESLEWPPDTACTIALVIQAFSGAVLNAGGMLLISFYGPVISAIATLSTLIVAAAVDFALGRPIAFATYIGSALIIASLAVLISRPAPSLNPGVVHVRSVTNSSRDGKSP